MSGKKNVLFITADQLRADCILKGSKYAKFVKTPNLDRLAGEGVTFEKHFNQAAPCGPARASLHTSMYARNHGVYDNGVPLRSKLSNWAQAIRSPKLSPRLIGYVDQTIDLLGPSGVEEAQVHWDGGYLDGLTRISDTDYMGSRPWLKEVLHLPDDDRIFKKKRNWNGYRGSVEWLARSNKADLQSTGKGYSAPALYDAENSDASILVQRSIGFIEEESRGGRPWALHLSLLKPHPPWTAPYPFNELYHPDDIEDLLKEKNSALQGASAELAGEDTDEHPWLQFLHTVPNDYAHHGASGTARNLSKKRKLLAMSAYFALLTELDTCLGKLFECLKSTGESENTLVVFTCDHGEQLYDHGLCGKLGFFEESFHIPLIVVDPFSKSSKGQRISKFSESIDIGPTIVEFLTGASPSNVNGRSLLPAIRGEGEALGQRDCAIFEYNYSAWGWHREEPHLKWAKSLGISVEECGITVLREDRFKYIHFHKLPPLLFDLKLDPGETKNVARIAKYAPVVARMEQKLNDWALKQSNTKCPISTLKVVADNDVRSLGLGLSLGKL